ncbi:T6SS effector phospholipase Tle3 domain-containing protein [Leclercia barmai]|uniref:T6SS effector phospholipase Tle3 domain-containing protein n=1 Tax=Leclercia barmai TaxID=2785629 RepID=UPI003BB8E2DB
MTETKTRPYAPRVISEGDIPVHKSLGEVAQTRSVGVPRPMPGIVILVHGVNDVGEAYQNQEKGILKGLGKRLNRQDFYPHEWKDYRITAPGRSPIIPFYWGYKPVTFDDYREDQKRYREEVGKLSDNARLPYDAYQEHNLENKKALGNDGQGPFKYQNDNFKNVLDMHFAKNGGTFANATTTIPDMLGPGAGGFGVAAAGFASLHFNGGDFTHPIYENPHRIYQFFAAQRLADLIMTIRREPITANDTINVVAHSQGTIITMLANMLVKQAGYDPVNCVILNHSPYSLESRVAENIQPGYQQTNAARQNTFKNFCNLMYTQWKGGENISESDILALEASCTLRKPSDNPLRTDDRYCRSNDGKVYNYFCPNDGVVSLENVQGFGWRGIPQKIARDIPNLYQRVFYQHGEVGKAPNANPFKLPPQKEGDAEYAFLTNSSYNFRDVVINGEELPEPFTFKLQGQDNRPDNDPKTSDKPYTYYIDPDSPDAYISYSAKARAIKRTDCAMYMLNSYKRISWKPGHVLTPDELEIESIARKHTVIEGKVTGSKEYPVLSVTWLKTREELEKEWQKTDPVGYSQHSSIVMSEFAPSQAMAFDVAIGQCKSFDYKAGKFWEELLHLADWRDPLNKKSDVKEYFRSGRLPEILTKFHMNKPDGVLPKGEYGVENNYAGIRPNVRNPKYIDMGVFKAEDFQERKLLQWEMPKPKSDSQLA